LANSLNKSRVVQHQTRQLAKELSAILLAEVLFQIELNLILVDLHPRLLKLRVGVDFFDNLRLELEDIHRFEAKQLQSQVFDFIDDLNLIGWFLNSQILAKASQVLLEFG
jgi:hypothetical protein